MVPTKKAAMLVVHSGRRGRAVWPTMEEMRIQTEKCATLESHGARDMLAVDWPNANANTQGSDGANAHSILTSGWLANTLAP